MLVAIITLAAFPGLPQADPISVAKKIYNFSKFEHEAHDFKGISQYQGFSNEVCAEYNGIDHPNLKGCCPAKCQKYCGSVDCWSGPGGKSDCCESSMTRVCDSETMAPCLLNTTKMAKVYRDGVCKKFYGIDSPGIHTCCPPTCGEFCGSTHCVNGPGGRSQCCAEVMTALCDHEHSAPCLLPSMVTYPIQHYDPGRVRLMPQIVGGLLTNYTVTPDLPDGLKLDSKTGEIHGHISSDFEDSGQKYDIAGKNLAMEYTTTVSLRNHVKPATLAYPDLDAQLSPGKTVRALPKWTGGHPSLFTVMPALPDGWKFDGKTGEIKGVFKKAEKHHKHVVTAINPAGEATSPIYLRPWTFAYPADHVNFPPGGEARFLPNVVGNIPTRFTITPSLPDGLKLNHTTGEIHGVPNASQTTDEEKYVLTGKSAAGNITSVMYVSSKPDYRFLWWIALVIGISIGVAIFLLKKPANDIKTYAPLVRAELNPSFDRGETNDPAEFTNFNNFSPVRSEPESAPTPSTPRGFPPIPAPAGIALVWDTDYGEQTVIATKKPLGLKFNRVLPIRIITVKEGHGKDIGIKLGWVLKSINNIDLTWKSSYQEADTIFHDEVGKLPR